VSTDRTKTLLVAEVVERLKALADPGKVDGMASFGINSENTLGISMPVLRRLGEEYGPDQELSLALWDTGLHEARILAALVGEPEKVTPGQMDAWIEDFDSWDVCDQVCQNLFDRTPHAWEKAREWSGRKREFEKRAGFALMACLAWHDKDAPDERFLAFLPRLEHESDDGRNYVKKAVSWALRQIGKRNLFLNAEAIRSAERIAAIDSAASRWVANDVLKEITSDKVRARTTE